MAAEIEVEVVFATADKQFLQSLVLPQGSTLADAFAGSGLAEEFPDTDFDRLQAGVWGRPLSRDHRLSDGDRVEFYRPLKLDPKDARRQLASLGLSMGKAAKG